MATCVIFKIRHRRQRNGQAVTVSSCLSMQELAQQMAPALPLHGNTGREKNNATQADRQALRRSLTVYYRYCVPTRVVPCHTRQRRRWRITCLGAPGSLMTSFGLRVAAREGYECERAFHQDVLVYMRRPSRARKIH